MIEQTPSLAMTDRHLADESALVGIRERQSEKEAEQNFENPGAIYEYMRKYEAACTAEKIEVVESQLRGLLGGLGLNQQEAIDFTKGKLAYLKELQKLENEDGQNSRSGLRNDGSVQPHRQEQEEPIARIPVSRSG